MTPTILTHSGQYFSFETPEKSRIDIETIAHALSNLCRFTGHTTQFYSVAQHSVLASYLVPPEHALVTLLHDAAEAYLGDVAAPLKQLLPDYKAIERRVETAVLAHFGLSADMPACVKRADLIMLATEQRDLLPPIDHEWETLAGVTPLERKLTPLQADAARAWFLARFEELTGGVA